MKFSLFSAVSVLALTPASIAAAQTTASPPAEEVQNEELVVTGTRIENPNFQSPTPLTSVGTDSLLKTAPTQIAEAINKLPQFQNSVSTSGATATGPANSQRFGNYLNLRSLGAQRVLVLQDGQRLQSTGNNGGVDATLIPQMLVRQVDVVTGGASAVYGSDAVSGVVNFIIDKHFKGLKFQASAGASAGGNFVEAGAGMTWRVAAAGGFSALDDRLHVVASAEHYHTNPIWRDQISRLGQGLITAGSGTAADPYYGVFGARYYDVGYYGNVLSEGRGPALDPNINRLAGLSFTPNGQGLMPFDRGVLTTRAGVSVGGDGTLFQQNGTTQVARQNVNQVFVRPEFEFGNDIVGFASLSYNSAGYDGNPGSPFRRQTVLFADNAFLPASAVSALAGGGCTYDSGATPCFRVASANLTAPGQWFYQDVMAMRINAGLSGTLMGRFKWNVGYAHDFNRFTSSAYDTNNIKYYAAVDAVKDSTGKAVCRVSLTSNANLYPGCVPLNILGSPNDAAGWAYAMDFSSWTARNEMDDFIATVSGDMFNLPGGPLSFAVGAEYRRLKFSQSSNSLPTNFPAFTGLRGVVSAFNLTHSTLNVGTGIGSQTVKEAFTEFSAPLFRDTSVGSLDLNGAVRLTDYSTSGSVVTWKVGGVYEPVNGVKFRATKSRDIRAPTLFELFAGRQQAAVPTSDPLTGQNQVAQVVSGGNASLVPEKANTFTLGFVVGPAAVPGLNFSVDYFSIGINKAIASPYTSAQIVSLCAASNYTSDVCGFIERPLGPTNTTAANFPTAIYTLNRNLASQSVKGIDFEARYSFNLGTGKVGLHAAATHLLKFTQSTSPTSGTSVLDGNADFADNPLPKWRGVGDISYTNGGLSVGIQERYVGSFVRSIRQTYAPAWNTIGEVWYTDFNLSYRVEDAPGKPEFFLVVNNVFDRTPPLAPQLGGPGLSPPWFTQVHDQLGRFATVGIRGKF